MWHSVASEMDRSTLLQVEGVAQAPSPVHVRASRQAKTKGIVSRLQWRTFGTIVCKRDRFAGKLIT
jgi:hypothetical protein